MAAALEITLEAYQALEVDWEHCITGVAETVLKMKNEALQKKVLNDLSELIAKERVPKEPAE